MTIDNVPVMATTFPSKEVGFSEPTMGETFAHANMVSFYCINQCLTVLNKSGRGCRRNAILMRERRMRLNNTPFAKPRYCSDFAASKLYGMEKVMRFSPRLVGSIVRLEF